MRVTASKDEYLNVDCMTASFHNCSRLLQLQHPRSDERAAAMRDIFVMLFAAWIAVMAHRQELGSVLQATA